jgi:hypothetical protein
MTSAIAAVDGKAREAVLLACVVVKRRVAIKAKRLLVIANYKETLPAYRTVESASGFLWRTLYFFVPVWP